MYDKFINVLKSINKYIFKPNYWQFFWNPVISMDLETEKFSEIYVDLYLLLVYTECMAN